jgi:AraC-like DNA-binding protein
MLTNQSINSFVRSVKIKRSAALIAEGMNVSEAAYSTGFNDLKYFRESFKKMYGKNPSEFKA